MTSKQRLLSAIRGDALDRVPVGPFTLGALERDSGICRELIERTDPLIPTWGGDPFALPGMNMESFDEGDVTTTIVHTPTGPLTQRVKHGEETDWRFEQFCKTANDLEAYMTIPWQPAEPYTLSLKDDEEYFGEDALVLIDLPNAVMLPHRLMSAEDFCMLWATDRNTFVNIVNEAQKRLEVFVEKHCQAGSRVFRMIGGELVTVQLGREAFDRLITPNDTRIVDMIHAHGGVVYYHNHGHIMRWLEPLAELGIDALDPLEAPPWGDADLARAAEILDGRVCMVGNIDDMEILGKLPYADIKAMGRKRLEETGGRHFILGGTASGTFGETAARNFFALLEAAEDFGPIG